MKKLTIAVLVGQFLAVGAAGLIASAQSMPVPVGNSGGPGFIQFNNLRVDSVSGVTPPAEILASNPSIVNLSVNAPTTGGGQPVPVPTPTPSVAPSSPQNCYKFNDQNATDRQTIPCPMPIRYQPYRIEVDASTRLMLRDRTPASLNNISAGDQINVFGYYNADGSIQAYLIRDLSKPVQDEFIQLNNVQLISISGTTAPATLVVTQQQGYPCYGFDAAGVNKQSIMCPMGMPVPAAASVPTPQSKALENAPVPPALAPMWSMLRKYVINIDANTIILDGNRARLSLSDLQVGDQLNIFGDTTDGGQTLTADIVRDVSMPSIPSTYGGQVIQVNADGSFVIQTNDGRMITVKNPIQVGASIKITGVLDRLQNVLSQVSSIFIGNNNIVPPPVPMPAPMPAVRVQSVPSPSTNY